MSGDAAAEAGEVPEWLDEAFVAEVLSEEEGAPVEVLSLRLQRAVAKGENYASLLLRAAVEYSARGERRTAALIVKTLPRGELMRGWLTEGGVFPRERRMYAETLPALQARLQAAAAAASAADGGQGELAWELAPSALRCARDDTLVLHDLRPLGFRMSSRRAGLDLPHARLVLRALARLHAASVALHADEPEHVESYKEMFYREESRERLERFVPVMLNNLAAAMEAWGDESKEHAERLRAFVPRALDATMTAVKPRDDFLNVLNHGDCWVNNCLFRYEDDAAGEDAALRDMRFVDFQIMRYASPALDLQYFLYTSVRAAVREAHWDALLDEYARALAGALRALGVAERGAGVDRAALQRQMDALAPFGVVAACCVLFAVVAEPADAIDLDTLTQEQVDRGELPFSKAIENDNYKSALQRLMPYFVEKGYL